MTSAAKSVPPAWRGLWRRVALEGPDGAGDVTSLVLWLQTASHFADIRLPPGRPSFEGVCDFADLNDAQIAYLAAQEGFAGHLSRAGTTATWHRAIDLGAGGGPPDEGSLVRDRRMMVEHGVHVDYVEHWWADDPAAADDTETLVVTPTRIAVRAGARFMDAHDRRGAAPPGSLAARFDFEIAAGRIAAGRFLIDHATLPWREGAEAKGLAAGGTRP